MQQQYSSVENGEVREEDEYETFQKFKSEQAKEKDDKDS
jgi:hypothetical protein